MYEHYITTDQDIDFATHALIGSSLYGLPMASIEFETNEFEDKKDMIIRTILMHTYSTSLGVLKFYE